MRRLIVFSLPCVALIGCGSSHSAAKPSPTPTLGPKLDVPPKTSPVPIKTAKGQRVPTPNPHITAAPLPTSKPFVAQPTQIPRSAFTARVFGTVTDGKTHAPLAGAIVAAGPAYDRVRAVTDGSGHYSIAFPGSASAPFTVTMAGYLQYLAQGTLNPHQSIRLNVVLQRKVAGAAPPAPGIFGNQ